MTEYPKLIDGFRAFLGTTHREQKDLIEHSVQQKVTPTTLFITCCDLRISPDTITSARPGELYVVRNMAGLVPPNDHKYSVGAMAAIEYAVTDLEVENIVVLGHVQCDAVKQLLASKKSKKHSESVNAWFAIAEEVKEAVHSQMQAQSSHAQEHACEQEVVVLSLRNLLAYPWVKKRVDKGKLKVYGWHFNLSEGILMNIDPNTGMFEPVG